jgi:hypothetical protein
MTQEWQVSPSTGVRTKYTRTEFLALLDADWTDAALVKVVHEDSHKWRPHLLDLDLEIHPHHPDHPHHPHRAMGRSQTGIGQHAAVAGNLFKEELEQLTGHLPACAATTDVYLLQDERSCQLFGWLSEDDFASLKEHHAKASLTNWLEGLKIDTATLDRALEAYQSAGEAAAERQTAAAAEPQPPVPEPQSPKQDSQQSAHQDDAQGNFEI